jgi:hypothetical protein
LEGSPDRVLIEFIRDIQPDDKSVNYRSGSQSWVDPATAAALILVGAAVRLPPSGANSAESPNAI